MVLSKRQNQKPGVVAAFPQSGDGGIAMMTKWNLSIFALVRKNQR